MIKKKAHLIGICGAGMSALAILLKESGYVVTGSDNGFYEPISGYLKKNKISFAPKYSAKNIPKNADLIVIGKHAELTPEENEEVRQAFKSGIRVQSLPEAIALLSKDKNNLIVAGSFGKSTCTALTSWCLMEAKKNPSYFIGAVPIGWKLSSHIGSGEDFVIEGDEYPSSNWDNNSKFLHFKPNAVLLTSGEHDHKNVFKTEKSYVDPYKKLVAKIPKEGLLVFSLDGKNNKEIVRSSKSETLNYSLNNKQADWYAENIKYGVETSFDLINNGKKIIRIKTQLLGNHNLENIVGCGAFLLESKKITPVEFAKAVHGFQGIKRRIELLTSRSSVPVYEGFGSSYAKAKSVFDALKLHFPKKKIITVFEPHTFSWRNAEAKSWYRDIFNTSEEVIILPPPEHGKATHQQMSFLDIIKEVKKNKASTYPAQNEQEVLELLKNITTKDNIIVLMSSGSLLGLTRSVPKMIEKMFKK
jgi:UDP-N-acetylmuramate: L-alanyl-gamma-D-glutamyl-meso-diaminopimelate ligase